MADSQGICAASDFVTWTLAEWAAKLRWEALAPEAIDAARRFIYDSVGCGLGGSRQADVQIVLEHARHMGGSPICTVIGSGHRTDPVTAALLNALCIRALDYNDIYWKADPVHPSDLIAAALVPCQMRGLGGRDLILGTVIAYEIEMRLAEFADPGIREYGWHHATLTALAAPIVAGRMLGLKTARIQQAVGIGAAPSMCLGAVTAGRLSNMKNTVDPMAVRAGVEAALLARRGYTGPEHVLDGKEGFVHCFEKFGGAFDVGRLAGGLPAAPGDHYRIVDCGMKSFPIEALSHAPLTAMMKIVGTHGIRAGDVKRIRVEVIARAADILGDPAKYRPTSRETADHSLPYALAVGLVDGMVTPHQFTPQRIADPGLRPIMDAVEVVANEEFEALFPACQPSRVTVTLRDGTTFVQRVDVPRGERQDPMTVDEIAVKFDALAGAVVGPDRCRRLRALILSLEREESLERFFALVTV